MRARYLKQERRAPKDAETLGALPHTDTDFDTRPTQPTTTPHRHRRHRQPIGNTAGRAALFVLAAPIARRFAERMPIEPDDAAGAVGEHIARGRFDDITNPALLQWLTHRTVVDAIRKERGRDGGHRSRGNAQLLHLDWSYESDNGDDHALGRQLATADDPASEAIANVIAHNALASIDGKRLEALQSWLGGEPLGVLADRWGVTNSSVSQHKAQALAAARSTLGASQ